jgi:hypothetical protein
MRYGKGARSNSAAVVAAQAWSNCRFAEAAQSTSVTHGCFAIDTSSPQVKTGMGFQRAVFASALRCRNRLTGVAHYSARKALSGSTLAALRAGIRLAITATMVTPTTARE